MLILLLLLITLANGESEYYNWTMEEIQTFREQFRNGTLIGLYERENIEDITKYKTDILITKSLINCFITAT